ncbi:unnamed protein product, partial [Mesorhabditis spiculigera]
MFTTYFKALTDTLLGGQSTENANRTQHSETSTSRLSDDSTRSLTRRTVSAADLTIRMKRASPQAIETEKPNKTPRRSLPINASVLSTAFQATPKLAATRIPVNQQTSKMPRTKSASALRPQPENSVFNMTPEPNSSLLNSTKGSRIGLPLASSTPKSDKGSRSLTRQSACDWSFQSTPVFGHTTKTSETMKTPAPAKTSIQWHDTPPVTPEFSVIPEVLPEQENQPDTVEKFNERRVHRYSNRPAFTDVEAKETLLWLEGLKQNDPTKLRTVIEELGLEPKTWGRRLQNKDTQKKLWKIRLRELLVGEKYSKSLEEFIQGNRFIEDQGEKIDDKYFRSVMKAGGCIRFYNYILVDSTELPKNQTISEISLEEFVNAVFYVGKGTDNRAIQHLRDAVHFDGPKNVTDGKLSNASKLWHINNIWDNKGAVYVLRVFNEAPENISHLREEAMITAFNVKNLTNDVRGHQLRGQLRGYTDEMLAIHGTFLIIRAHKVFCNNLPPPIRRQNLLDMIPMTMGDVPLKFMDAKI